MAVLPLGFVEAAAFLTLDLTSFPSTAFTGEASLDGAGTVLRAKDGMAVVLAGAFPGAFPGMILIEISIVDG